MRRQLTEKYRPIKLDEFVGIEGPRKILTNLAADPYASAWLLLGESGTGKTTLAQAVAKAIGAELYHVPSSKCTVDKVNRIMDRCEYIPFGGAGFHLVLIDEANEMSRPAQNTLLSILDNLPHSVIFMFTANVTTGLEPRFLSRCKVIRFESKSIAPDVAPFLENIWRKENGKGEPDFTGLYRKSGNNIRSALMNLELMLIDPSHEIPEAKGPALAMRVQKSVQPGPVDPCRRAAALKAWETMRARRA